MSAIGSIGSALPPQRPVAVRPAASPPAKGKSSEEASESPAQEAAEGGSGGLDVRG